MATLTKERLLKVKPGKPFATGLLVTSDGKLSRWVAKRGQVNDWAIYQGEQAELLQIMEHGNKVYDNEDIKRLVPCDKSALSLYRK